MKKREVKMKKKKIAGISALIPFTLCNFSVLPVSAEAAEYQELDAGLEEYSADCQVIYKEKYDFSEEIPKYPELEVSASGYTGIYDGKAHGISVDCKTAGATILYSMDGRIFTDKKPVYKDAGTYITYYKVEKEGYATTTGHAVVKIEEGKINYTLNEYNGPYDGKPHGIDLSVKTNGYKVLYSEDGINFTLKQPEYKEPGTYTVYYKIIKDNYETVTGSGKITIHEKDSNIKLSDTSGTVKVDDSIKFTVDTDGVPFDVTISDPSIAKITVKNGIVTVTGLKEGTAMITITSNGKSATYKVSVVGKDDIKLSDTSAIVKVDDSVKFTIDTGENPFDVIISDSSIPKNSGKNGSITDPSKNSDKQQNVQTGDNSNIFLYSMMLILSVFGFVKNRGKREKRKL